MQLNISKTKEGKWSPEKSEKVFKFLGKNMNGMELANLTERLISDDQINQKCIDSMSDKVKTPKEALIELHRKLYGGDLSDEESELSLIIEILIKLERWISQFERAEGK